MGPEAQHILC